MLWQNGRHFPETIFLNENVEIVISLKYVPEGPVYNNSSIGSDNGLAPARWQAIIWTNDTKGCDWHH